MMAANLLAFSGRDFIPADELAIAINDAGFVWGATVTDLCRTFHQRIYRWSDHLARFRNSCQSAFIDIALDDAGITRAAETLVEHNANSQEMVLVLLATPGLIGYYSGQQGTASAATFVMHTFPLPTARYRHLFEQGARLVIPSIRQPAHAVPPHIKQRSRMHWWLAEHEVRQVDSAAAALLLDDEGFVTETAAANFLVVLDGEVVSPPTDAVLPGVSLLVVRELCRELGIVFREQPLRLEDCLQATEAFLSSTGFCIAGVRSLAGHEFRWPGPVFERLLAAWSAKVGVDICKQIVGG